MLKFEQNAIAENGEEILYREREKFIRENYPESANYELQELVNSGLDGMDVLEKRDRDGEIEGLISYAINQDNKEITYISVGVMLTREDLQGEGIMRDLFSQIKNIARNSDCEYIVAVADTEEGREFLLNNGFNEEKDNVNRREILKLDL